MSSRWITEYGLGVDQQLKARKNVLRAALQHSSAKGQAAENGLILSLAQMLGTRFHRGNGQIVDSRDHLSGQVDIILFDESQPFVPEQSHTPGIFLADSTVAAVEVKLALDVRNIDDLLGDEGPLHRLKKIRRAFNCGDRIPNTTTETEFLRFYNSIASVVFAYESNVKPVTVLKRLNERGSMTVSARDGSYEYKLPLVDALFVLGQGVFLNLAAARPGGSGLGFSFGRSGCEIQDGDWVFFPDVVDGKPVASTAMRFSFLMTYVVPRIERFFPPALHYLAEPSAIPVEPQAVSVQTKLGDWQLPDSCAHVH